MCPQMISGLAVLALVTLGARVAAYTNQWAVHVEGGPEIAQSVAMEHGFQYLDKVRDGQSI
ncbi:furin-like [Augochlora pura]